MSSTANHLLLRCMNISSKSSAIFTKGNDFYEIPFDFPDEIAIPELGELINYQKADDKFSSANF